MAKSVSLSLHKNKVEARRKRELAKNAKAQVESIIREQDIRAYAFVGIAADGSAYARWDTGALLPLWSFADTVAHVLREDIRSTGAADDWRPNLTLKG